MDELEHLKEQLKADTNLLKEFENKLRFENDPRQKLKWTQEIEEIKERIKKRKDEINQIEQEIRAIPENIPPDIYDNKINPGIINDSQPENNGNNINNNTNHENIIRRYKKAIPIIIACIVFLIIVVIHQLNSPIICPNLKDNININLPLSESLSCGEKSLISGSISNEKKNGIEAYNKNDYAKAIELLQKARDKEQNDPETLIYLNNAKIEENKITAYTIAVVVPLNKNSYTSLQLLRGVAQAQEEWLSKENYQPRIGLKVLIANDANDINRAKEIATILVQQKHILAVIGHYASDLTLATRDIYEKGQLVSVSPGSTAAELPRQNDQFFFRTIPSLEKNVTSVKLYLRDKQYSKIGVFYNPDSDFSRSFFKKLKDDLSLFGIDIINDDRDRDFHLSHPFFKPSKAIKKANAMGVKAFVLIPDGGTTDYSLPNSFKLIKASRPDGFFIIGANPLFKDETLLLGEDVVGRLVITTPWIQTTASQSNFAQKAEKLWQGREISSWTVTAYDATQVLIQALFKDIKHNPTRLTLQATLIDPQFKAEGADETTPIMFDKGNRKKEKVELAKIVKSNCPEFGYSFVPEKYTEQQIKDLENSCKR